MSTAATTAATVVTHDADGMVGGRIKATGHVGGQVVGKDRRCGDVPVGLLHLDVLEQLSPFLAQAKNHGVWQYLVEVRGVLLLQ